MEGLGPEVGGERRRPDVHHRRFTGDGHGFRHGGDLEGHRHRDGAVPFDDDALAHQRLESGDLEAQVVGAAAQRAESVRAVAQGDRRLFGDERLAGEGDVRSGYGEALGVGDPALDLARGLAEGGGAGQRPESERRRNECFHGKYFSLGGLGLRRRARRPGQDRPVFEFVPCPEPGMAAARCRACPQKGARGAPGFPGAVRPLPTAEFPVPTARWLRDRGCPGFRRLGSRIRCAGSIQKRPGESTVLNRRIRLS